MTNKINEYTLILNKFNTFYNSITDDFMSKLIYSINCYIDLLANNTILNNDNIYLSFNGGKDCLAAYLILKYYYFCKENNMDYTLKSSYNNFCKNHNEYKIDKKILLVYFVSEKNFSEEEDYVINFANAEDLRIVYLVSDYINGLAFLKKRFNLNLIIMGTRKDDIKYKIENNDNLIFPSTSPYPEFLRFYPVFNWTFEDIWRIILSSKIRYLDLYNMGYSSIGRKNNSKINENLKFADGLILPAWCLEEYLTERTFRM
jgi:3'-phosphoadenosine 5'-phosphosulfate sulfotransferase (PAPS reductase)/FAD synthetase